MARTPRDKLEREFRKLDELVDDGEMPVELRDRLLNLSDAMDEASATRKFYDKHGEVRTYAPGTIRTYLSGLRLSCERGLDLLEADAEEIDSFMDSQVDDRGMAKQSVSTYQSAAVAFHRYNDDLPADPDAINIFKEQSEPRHDEADMFTKQDIDALRDACTKARDRALLELLIYTGQRITAILTLERRHVDCEKGVLYLNKDADGLKGAADRGRKRPLFGARRFVREWKHEYHPENDNPEAPLFVGDYSNPKTDRGEPWSYGAAKAQLNRMKEEAGIDKPVNPHNFRHYFVTVMKREYDVDSDTLRALLGTVKNSEILDTTYQHITNDEFVEKAEEQLGYRESGDSERKSFTPDVCKACGQVLQNDWSRCPRCGEVYSPDLENIREDLSDARRSAVEATADPDTNLTEEEVEAVRTLIELVDDTDSLVEILDTGV